MRRSILFVLYLLSVTSFPSLSALCEPAAGVPRSATDEYPIEAQMIAVPGGIFVMGGDGYPYNTPRRFRRVERFLLGKYEVTEEEFMVFYHSAVDSPECDYSVIEDLKAWSRTDRMGPNYPVVGIQWSLADAYTKWPAETTGKPYRLPTEIEWEFAAGGSERRTWPWGETYNRNNFNGFGVHGRDSFKLLSPIGCFPEGSTPLGICDMSGNVAEWCADRPVTFEDPRPIEWQAHLGQRISRGGFADGGAIPFDQTVRHRAAHDSRVTDECLGFRVASDPVEPTSASSTSVGPGVSADFLRLTVKARDSVAGIPIGKGSRPWVLLHAILAFGYREPLRNADDPPNMFLPIQVFQFRHSFSPPKDPSAMLFLVDENGIRTQRGQERYYLEDHAGQSVFVFSQVDLPEFHTLSTGPRGAFMVSDVLSSVLYQTHGFEDLSWVLPALVYYRGEWCRFTNRFGETLDLNNLLKKFMEDFNGRSDRPCLGTHYHYCLAYLKWYDGSVPIMDDEARNVLKQELDKSYRADCASIEADSKQLPSNLEDLDLKDLNVAVYSIGHRLEWLVMWALSQGYDPSTLQPYFETLAPLVEETAKRLKRSDDNPKVYGALCHAVHAFNLAAR